MDAVPFQCSVANVRLMLSSLNPEVTTLDPGTVILDPVAATLDPVVVTLESDLTLPHGHLYRRAVVGGIICKPRHQESPTVAMSHAQVISVSYFVVPDP